MASATTIESWASSPHVIDHHIEAIVGEQDARVASAVAQIKGEGPKLLALRSYLRAGPKLSERWSWTEQQIATYEDSLERQALQLEIERVRAAFAKANPGFELYVNPAVRSLDDQIEKWNSSDSVTEAGARLLGDVAALLASPELSYARCSARTPDAGSVS